MAEQRPPAGTSRGRMRRGTLVIAVVLVIAIAALARFLAGRGWVSTDDAQVEGDLVPISSRISGYVRRVYVRDNQNVSAGRILVELDTRDLEARLREAEANLSLQRAQAAAAATQVAIVEKTSRAGERQAEASMNAAGAGVGVSMSQIISAEAQAASAKAAAQAAQDAVDAARSEAETAQAQIDAAQAALQAARAEESAAEAQARKVTADTERTRKLFEQGAAPRQQLDAAVAADVSAQAALKAARERVTAANAALAQARARKRSADAAVRQAESRAASARALADQAAAGVRAARKGLSEARARFAGASAAASGARTASQQISASRAQRDAALARVRQAKANLRNARLQLSYTRILAPMAGVISQKSVKVGQFVQPGQALMSIVPLHRVWIVANFKETQLSRMRAGQPVQIKVDTYPGRVFRARIDSIGAATGAKFSLLPPENATGNFVKVVQRIPVKIVFDQPLPKGIVLRPGMNVIARVNVRDRRS